MATGQPARTLRNRIGLGVFRVRNLGKEKFRCPNCGFYGPFRDVDVPTGFRRHAQCPGCGALERHRIQHLVMARILEGVDAARLSMLHFAPEPFFREDFRRRFGHYLSADLKMAGVDHAVNLESLPFEDASFDFVFASHVLEHVANDGKAIAEIRRVLRPKGMAVLPVPLVAHETVEYPAPNPHESFHVRAPGSDYFDRYARHFSRVEKFGSDAFPGEYQLYVYEDRTRWPTKECPLRPRMQGERHADIVPVCYV